MQLSTLLLLPLVALASASPKYTSTPKSDPAFCERGLKLCEIAQSWEDCSDLYIASMKACILTNCIQWIQDPLRHCEK
ncbi:hypothetical protein K440DRAFT_635642 [Wilcoxina mikolae CBS 423.85]|nr:hypothetical protein K440DRAFT_635642 [Wilcoxina mikolae CBS 423.85]